MARRFTIGKRGRKPLPDGQKKKQVQIYLTGHLVEWFAKKEIGLASLLEEFARKNGYEQAHQPDTSVRRA